MTLTDAGLILGAGFLAGFINTIAGGGSLITLPLLIFMGLPSSIANATNRVAIFSQNIFATGGFASKGVSVFPYNIYLGISALFGAVIGASLAVDIDGKLFNRILAGVMIMVVFFTVFNPMKGKNVADLSLSGKHKAIGIMVFFFVGIYGGFIQAGVGFLIMFSLVFINKLDLVRVNSIKVVVVLIYTSAALAVFIYNDQVNWKYGLTLAAGNSTGGWIASRWSVKKGDVWIKRILIITVIALAIKLWLQEV